MHTAPNSRERVAIVGAGTMGSGLATVFAANGHPVTLLDVAHDALAKGLQRAELSIRLWLGEDEAADVLSLIDCQTDLESAVRHVDLVIEAVTEDLQTKQTLFERLDRLVAPSALLCSNSSSLPLAEVMARVERCERVMGTHWFNPPYLIPAVEVVRGRDTSDATIDRVITILKALGKVPVEVKDMPGFLANRLQMALVKEAMLCIEEGVASPADIDKLVTQSIGLRLVIAGPLAVADLSGLDVYLKIFETLAGGVSERFEPPKVLKDLIAQGKLGVKTEAGFFDYKGSSAASLEVRDRRLLALSQLRASDSWEKQESGSRVSELDALRAGTHG